VIPAFNAATSVGRSVASALGQSLRELEVIVVDDGSSDDTAAAARAAGGGDPRLRVVSLPANAGVSVARNAALDLARGDWLAVLDADDTFEPERCARLRAEAELRRSDLIADNIVVYRTDIDEAPSLAFPRARMSTLAAIDAAAYVATDRPGWGTRASGFTQPLMRRAFVEGHGLRYAPEFSHGEDFHFVVRALLRGAVLHYVDAAYYRYGISPNSLSRAGFERILRSFRGVGASLRDEARRFGRPDVVRQLDSREAEMDAWLAYRSLREAVLGGRFVAAARIFATMPGRGYACAQVLEGARRRVGVQRASA
jgi:succinoglycan biosynthesis protein ExoO/succinoglycan biosynthesis protein ExoU